MMRTELEERIPVSAELKRARIMARALDTMFELPGGMKIGLDGLIGIIPGIGDLISSVASVYIVLLAIRAGVSRPAVVRMVGNIALDTLVGAVPVLGDAFDVAWKSNARNVAIFEREVGATGARRVKSRTLLILVTIGALLVLAVLAYSTLAFVRLVLAKLS